MAATARRGRAVAGSRDSSASGGFDRLEDRFVLLLVVVSPRVERGFGDRLGGRGLAEGFGLRCERIRSLLGLVVLLLATGQHLDVRGDDLGLPVPCCIVLPSSHAC